jgi:hypothetical protein
MIEADLSLLLQWCIVADLHQRYLVRLVAVWGHEGGQARPEVVGVEA